MGDWYLVRHGETKWNAQQRVQGQTDTPLHGPGREHLAHTARRLKDTFFDAVYSSDLSRARETAEIIVAGNDRGPYDVREDPLLREVSFGEFEGMTWTDIQNADAELRVRQLAHDLDYQPSGGESYRQLLERLGGFADLLRTVHADHDVLVVGHGAALRALAVRLLDLPAETYWVFQGLASGSVSIVRRRHGRATLVTWNDTGHFPSRSDR